MRYRFKIPTKHNVWHVFFDKSALCADSPVSFFTCRTDQYGILLTRQPLESVSKTIWKRAKCFLLHPERFGHRYYF